MHLKPNDFSVFFISRHVQVIYQLSHPCQLVGQRSHRSLYFFHFCVLVLGLGFFSGLFVELLGWGWLLLLLLFGEELVEHGEYFRFDYLIS